VIELEVVGVAARALSDEEQQHVRDQAAAHAEQAAASGPVVVDVPTWEHRLRLKERTGDRVLEFGIGPAEAMAITMALQGEHQPRPMTHDLIRNLLGALDDVSVVRTIITKLEPGTNRGAVNLVSTPAHPPPGTFHGALELQHRDDVVTLDCRPSDGIAVAVRLGVPIVAANELEAALVKG
jgi:bifunctional DNase/RNase